MFVTWLQITPFNFGKYAGNVEQAIRDGVDTTALEVLGGGSSGSWFSRLVEQFGPSHGTTVQIRHEEYPVVKAYLAENAHQRVGRVGVVDSEKLFKEIGGVRHVLLKPMPPPASTTTTTATTTGASETNPVHDFRRSFCWLSIPR